MPQFHKGPKAPIPGNPQAPEPPTTHLVMEVPATAVILAPTPTSTTPGTRSRRFPSSAMVHRIRSQEADRLRQEANSTLAETLVADIDSKSLSLEELQQVRLRLEARIRHLSTVTVETVPAVEAEEPAPSTTASEPSSSPSAVEEVPTVAAVPTEVPTPTKKSRARKR